MSIATESNHRLDELRTRLRKMSDGELMRFARGFSEEETARGGGPLFRVRRRIPSVSLT
jgi:hypothetical protein